MIIIINAPKRFVGRQLRKGEMEPLAAAIKSVLQKVEGVQFGIAQGLTTELRKPRNSLNVFINPILDRGDPFDAVRAALPQLKYTCRYAKRASTSNRPWRSYRRK